jgi:hypothetical protein
MENITNQENEMKVPNMKISQGINFHDPKVIALMAVSFLFVFLVVLIIIITIAQIPGNIRKKLGPTATPTPISITDNRIPDAFKTRFSELDKEIKQVENLVPPEIDQNIGQ